MMRVHTQTQTAPRCQKTSQCVDSSMTTHRCCKHAGRERAVVRTFESVLGNGSGIDHPRSPSTRLVPSKETPRSTGPTRSIERVRLAENTPPLSPDHFHHSPGPLHHLDRCLPPTFPSYHPFLLITPPLSFLITPLPPSYPLSLSYSSSSFFP